MSTDIATRTPAQQLVAQIRSDGVRAQIEAVLPENVSIEKFQRMTSTAILTKPELATADRESFFRELIKCASLGFVPDGRQAAIIVDRNRKCQLRDMIGGWRDLLASYGWALRTQAVRESDEFDWSEEPPEISHRKARPGVARGEIVAAYAVAVHRDGRRVQAVMLEDGIAKRRAKAQTQDVWNAWPDEQAEKTVGRYLARRLGLDPADRIPARVVDATDPVAALYGNTHHEVGLPGPGLTRPLTDSGTETSTGQQAAPAEERMDEGPQPQSSSAAVGAAPGPTPDEIEFGGFVEPEFVRLANLAAQYVPPFGKYGESEPVDEKLRAQWAGPHTLAQILAANPGYILWLLKNVTAPPDYVQAVETFARVHAPEAYQQALAEREASA